MMRKNKPSQRHHGTFIGAVILLLVVFMAGFVSSFEFDNIKDYNSDTRIATINNCGVWLGFCLIKGDVIATAQLETPLNVKVGAGVDQQVGIFNFVAEEDGNNIFSSLDLEDLKNGGIMARGKQYKVETFKEILVDDYIYSCKYITLPNETVIENCEYAEIGSHLETVVEWKPIKAKTEFTAGVKYRIGVYVDVEIEDYGDWVPTFYGVEVEEWATWTQDLNTGIVSYYRLDDDDFSDELGNYDATNTGTDNRSGKIGSGRQFIDGNTDFIDLGTITEITGDADYTISMWVYPDQISNQVAISGGHGITDRFTFMWRLGDIEARSIFGGSDITAGGTWTSGTGAWTLITMVHHLNNSMEVYENLNLRTGTDVNTAPPSVVGMNLGTYQKADNWYDGGIDEVGIWARILTTDEIIQLYNAGAGISYTDVFDTAPEITLNSPTTQNYTTHQSLEINFTALDDMSLESVKLYVNDILNQTNASGINNTNYLFNLDLGDGDYTIYGRATDNNSAETNSSFIIIGINSMSPVLTITDTTDAYTYSLPYLSTLNMSVVDVYADTCLYWTSNNATNITITCGTPVNPSWATGGNKTIYAWVNNTYSLTDTAQDSFYINYIQESLGYETTVLSGDSQTLYLNITATDITTYDINFTYNGSNYIPTVSNFGALLQASVTLLNPTTQGDYIINWTYQINALTNSTNVTQTVKDLTAMVITGGACVNPTVTFKLQDEVNATNLTGSISYNIKFGPSELLNDQYEV